MNVLRTLLAAVTVAAASSAARADIVIDDFSSPSAAIVYTINLNNPNPSTFVTNGVQPGINRSVTMTVTSPASPQFDSLTGSIGGPAGLFSMSLNSVSSGTAKISYTFSSAMNFIPNVASGGAVGSLEYNTLADPGFGSSVPLGFVIHTATGDLTFNGTMNLTAVFTPTDVSLSSFTGTGDLTQVTGMDITITAGQAADVELDALGITTPPPPESVPAPPAALLALLALPALGLRNRGKKKEIAVA